jgi:hypothetical protein
MRELRKGYKSLVPKSKGKSLFRRGRSREEDNIKMDVKKRRRGECGVDSFGSGYRPMVGSCERGNERSSFGK